MINPTDIINEVTTLYFLPQGSLLKYNRKPRISEARALAMYLLRYLCLLSWQEISEYLERDIGAVKNGCKKIARILESNEPWASRCINCCTTITEKFREE